MPVIIGLGIVYPVLCLIGIHFLFVGNPTNPRYFHGEEWRYNFSFIGWKISALGAAIGLTVTIPLFMNCWPSWHFFNDLYHLKVDAVHERHDPEVGQNQDPEMKRIREELRAIHNQNTDGYVRTVEEQIRVDRKRIEVADAATVLERKAHPGTGPGSALLLFSTIIFVNLKGSTFFIRNRLRAIEAQGFDVGDIDRFWSRENIQYCKQCFSLEPRKKSTNFWWS